MKHVFTLVLCCSLSALQAQTNNPFNDLKGSWQERARLDKNGDFSEFTDTLRMDFAGEGLCVMRYGKEESVVGAGELDGEKFRFKGKTYTLKVQNLNEFELGDGSVRHTLKRVGQYGGAIPKLARGAGLEEGEVKTDLASWQGKWTCYRKTDAAFTSTKFYIKHIEVSDAIPPQPAQVTWQNMDSIYTAEMAFLLKGKSLELKSKNESQLFEVLKSDGEEMILKREGVVYYLKRFTKR